MSFKAAENYDSTYSEVTSFSSAVAQQNENASGSPGESKVFHCDVVLKFYERTLEPINADNPTPLHVYSGIGLVPQNNHWLTSLFNVPSNTPRFQGKNSYKYETLFHPVL